VTASQREAEIKNFSKCEKENLIKDSEELT